MNRLNDPLLGALIGVAKASEGKTLETSTGDALIEGLRMAFGSQNPNEEAAAAMIERLQKEKHVMSPDCAACQYPCGRTDDFDMDEVYGASEQLRDAKLRLLTQLGRAAASLRPAHADADTRQFLSESLFLISCTYEAGQLDASLARAAALLSLGDHAR